MKFSERLQKKIDSMNMKNQKALREIQIIKNDFCTDLHKKSECNKRLEKLKKVLK